MIEPLDGERTVSAVGGSRAPFWTTKRKIGLIAGGSRRRDCLRVLESPD